MFVAGSGVGRAELSLTTHRNSPKKFYGWIIYFFFTLCIEISSVLAFNCCLITTPPVFQHIYHNRLHISLTVWSMFSFEVLFLRNLTCGTVLCFQMCFGNNQTLPSAHETTLGHPGNACLNGFFVRFHEAGEWRERREVEEKGRT